MTKKIKERLNDTLTQVLDDWKIQARPCVGCGYCCMQTKCSAGLRLYPSAETCPALVWSVSDKRYWCKLMTPNDKVGEGYRDELYAGAGCCSALNTWRQDVKERLPKLKRDECAIINIDPLFQIFLKALGREMISGDVLYLILSGMESNLQNKGCSDYEIKEIKKSIVYHIINNRNTLFDSFIGEFNHFNEEDKNSEKGKNR